MAGHKKNRAGFSQGKERESKGDSDLPKEGRALESSAGGRKARQSSTVGTLAGR